MKLNACQTKGISEVKKWWLGSEKFMVIQAPAGYGKTFMAWQGVKQLPGCSPLLTAPTNAAVHQLRLTIPQGEIDDKSLKTTYSAFNCTFDSSKQHKELTQKRQPNFDDHNLLVVEEASFIGQRKHIKQGDIKVSLEDLINSAVNYQGMKVLFIGHKSQLPEVEESENVSIADKCISPVFERNYREFNLQTPMRAKGDLQKAHDYLETLIYEERPKFKNDWRISEGRLNRYIKSTEGKLELLEGSSKILAYRNKRVDELNIRIRASIFNGTKLPFVEHDRLILTQPVGDVGRLSEKTKASVLTKTKPLIPTNSVAVVVKVNETTILGLPCWELLADIRGEYKYLYVPKDAQQFEEFSLTKRKAVFASQEGEKGWNKYHNMMDCFTQEKYEYAITVHRAQGTTIPKIFVDWDDIGKCTNQWLRHKLLYVAGSRSSYEMFIKG